MCLNGKEKAGSSAANTPRTENRAGINDNRDDTDKELGLHGCKIGLRKHFKHP